MFTHTASTSSNAEIPCLQKDLYLRVSRFLQAPCTAIFHLENESEWEIEHELVKGCHSRFQNHGHAASQARQRTRTLVTFFSELETAQIGYVQESEEKLIPNTEVTLHLQEKVLVRTLQDRTKISRSWREIRKEPQTWLKSTERWWQEKMKRTRCV